MIIQEMADHLFETLKERFCCCLTRRQAKLDQTEVAIQRGTGSVIVTQMGPLQRITNFDEFGDKGTLNAGFQEDRHDFDDIDLNEQTTVPQRENAEVVFDDQGDSVKVTGLMLDELDRAAASEDSISDSESFKEPSPDVITAADEADVISGTSPRTQNGFVEEQTNIDDKPTSSDKQNSVDDGGQGAKSTNEEIVNSELANVSCVSDGENANGSLRSAEKSKSGVKSTKDKAGMYNQMASDSSDSE